MASGDTLILLQPIQAEHPTSSSARFDTRNRHRVLDFAIGEYITFKGILPAHYGNGGLTIILWYAMTFGNANYIALQTAIERIGEDLLDIWGSSFDAPESTGDDMVPSFSGRLGKVSSTHAHNAEMDDLLVGEAFRLQIQRVSASGTDASGDLELYAVEIQET